MIGALVAGIVLAAVISVSPAQARDKVFRAQLDGDAPREELRTQVRGCSQPSACSRLVVRDGSRRRALTPFRQPRTSYGWTVRRARLLDFTGDGVREIAYELFTVGGTGSSPTLFGVSQWTGRSARRIFEFRNGREPEPGYAFVISVVTRIATKMDSLPEIETFESLHRQTDGTCCPSAFRITRHRWDGARLAPVPGSTRIEPA